MSDLISDVLVGFVVFGSALVAVARLARAAVARREGTQ